jgi:uncharacterized protein (DUF433 family)
MRPVSLPGSVSTSLLANSPPWLKAWRLTPWGPPNRSQREMDLPKARCEFVDMRNSNMDDGKRESLAGGGVIDRNPRWGVSSRMDYRDRITIEPGKRGGKACIRGLRITVYEVLDFLASGMTEAEILADFPNLETEDIRAVLAFAADRERKLFNAPSP